ncbi:hypothetical protein BpHYR1_016212 [Brachionus plicatilis]|uniref:Uncharacterized protein n=1 Tax=Brachionus plicatilis TaxID=10195 RepID=A0A3M7RI12_BRAPC|nr:hypothetical protein BpHYR1_016212 [Brachionus plicatilis]
MTVINLFNKMMTASDYDILQFVNTRKNNEIKIILIFLFKESIIPTLHDFLKRRYVFASKIDVKNILKISSKFSIPNYLVLFTDIN